MIININKLKKLAPRSSKDINAVASAFNKWLPLYQINTERRVDAFLAQALHETGGFRWWRELGSEKYFQKYEPNTSIGKRLGNIYPGDGYRYRGRGIFQLTGRYNYGRMGVALNLDLLNHPDWASTIDVAIQIACQYWKDKNLNRFADIGDIKTITYRINGGLNGFQDRLKYYTNLLKWAVWG